MRRLRYISLVVGATLALHGCASQPESYRDTGAPLGATTRFDVSRFAGQWTIMASFEPRKRAPIAFSPQREETLVLVSSTEIPQVAGLYRQGVPGELIPLSADQETLIVMWVDADFRTAALGTASGSLGLVLNRDDDLPDDRARAARDILAFYGWDISQLKGTIK